MIRLRSLVAWLIVAVVTSVGASAQLQLLNTGVGGKPLQYGTFYADMSQDGRFVLIESAGTLLYFDRTTLTATLIDTNASWPSISGNGRYVCYTPQSGGKVYFYDRETGSKELVNYSSTNVLTTGSSFSCAVSDDGRYVAFEYSAKLTPSEREGKTDIFLRDRLLKTTILVNRKPDGNECEGGPSVYPDFTPDGHFIAFQSSCRDLIKDGGMDSVTNIFVYDVTNGTIDQASVTFDGSDTKKNSQYPSISNDGTYVTFRSTETKLVPNDTNNDDDIFVFNRTKKIMQKITNSTSPPADQSGVNRKPTISGNGRFVAFESIAPDLVANDTNGLYDVFLHDLVLNKTVRVNLSASGAQANNDAFRSLHPVVVSNDGEWTTFLSRASNLVGSTEVDKSYAYVARNPLLTPIATPVPTVTATPTITPTPTATPEGIPGDKTAPEISLKKQSVRQGSRFIVQYSVSDPSFLREEITTIYKGKKKLSSRKRTNKPAVQGGPRLVSMAASKIPPGKYQLCVSATDAAGNKTSDFCVMLTVRSA